VKAVAATAAKEPKVLAGIAARVVAEPATAETASRGSREAAKGATRKRAAMGVAAAAVVVAKRIKGKR